LDIFALFRAKIIKKIRDWIINFIKIDIHLKIIITTIVLFVVIIQIFVSHSFCTLPLYGYATGAIDVNKVNELQKESGFNNWVYLLLVYFFLMVYY
jgi:hypothetical protein